MKLPPQLAFPINTSSTLYPHRTPTERRNSYLRRKQSRSNCTHQAAHYANIFYTTTLYIVIREYNENLVLRKQKHSSGCKKSVLQKLSSEITRWVFHSNCSL
uniref:Ovule protein n=1 Tax=Ascaris lumbricoides TaxID=6252 RepID=A0A0M3HNN8_ASCLU